MFFVFRDFYFNKQIYYYYCAQLSEYYYFTLFNLIIKVFYYHIVGSLFHKYFDSFMRYFNNHIVQTFFDKPFRNFDEKHKLQHSNWHTCLFRIFAYSNFIELDLICLVYPTQKTSICSGFES